MKIQILGERGEGKSTVAKIIEDALKHYGYSVSNMDPEEGQDKNFDLKVVKVGQKTGLFLIEHITVIERDRKK